MSLKPAENHLSNNTMKKKPFYVAPWLAGANGVQTLALPRRLTRQLMLNKKHLKNVGPIRHNEPPHAHSPDVASGTVARRLCIDVHDMDNDDKA